MSSEQERTLYEPAILLSDLLGVLWVIDRKERQIAKVFNGDFLDYVMEDVINVILDVAMIPSEHNRADWIDLINDFLVGRVGKFIVVEYLMSRELPI